jgi:hypothetical protein
MPSDDPIFGHRLKMHWPRSEVDTKEARVMEAEKRAPAQAGLSLPRKTAGLGVPVLYRCGAPAWMKLITTFPLERYDTPAFEPQTPPRSSKARRSHYD